MKNNGSLFYYALCLQSNVGFEEHLSWIKIRMIDNVIG